MTPICLDIKNIKPRTDSDLIEIAKNLFSVSEVTLLLLLHTGMTFKRLRLVCAIIELRDIMVYDIPMKDKYSYIAKLYGYSASSVRQFHRNHPEIYKSIENNGKKVQ